MALVEILVNGIPLDLFDEEENRFYITKQMDDVIKSLETLEGDFTRTISAPATTKNIELLGVTRVETAGSVRTDFVPCKVYFKGVTVLDDGNLVVTSNNGAALSITVFGGNTSFFAQLSDDLLSELNLSEYNFEWTLDNAHARKNNAEGLLFANSIFTDNASVLIAIEAGADEQNLNLENINLQWGGFWFYFKTMLEHIFENLEGLTVDFSALDADFERLIFAVPVKGFIRGRGLPPGYNGSGTVPDPSSVPTQTTAWIIPTVFVDPGGLWDPGANAGAGAWVVPEDGLCHIEILINGSVAPRFPGSTTDTVLEVFAAGLVIESRILSDSTGRYDPPTPFNERILVSFNGKIGDEVALRIKTGQITRPGDKVGISEMYFGFKRQLETLDRNLSIADLMPDISQKQFVLNVLNWFHIVATENNRVISFTYWDQIPTTPAQLIKSPANKEAISTTIIPNYGQINIIKYADNNLVQRLDLSAQFPVNSNTLPPSVVKIDLIFSGTDIYEGPLFDVLTPPNFVYEYEAIDNNKMSIDTLGNYDTIDANPLNIGDIIRIQNNNYQVVTVNDSRTGVVTPAPAQLNSLDWEFVHYTQITNDGLHVGYAADEVGLFTIADGPILDARSANHKIAVWPEFMTMQGILNRYFFQLTKTVESPVILQVWLNLSVLEFIELDHRKPIYIEQFSRSFYINKLEQFKAVGLCRFELIKV